MPVPGQPRRSSLLVGLLLAGAGAHLTACTGDGQRASGLGVPPAVVDGPAPASGDAQGTGVEPATDSERLVVHALTRVGADAAGQPAIILHFELLDRYGQAVKSLGVLSASLPAPPPGDGDPTHPDSGGRTWQVDLRDPKTNALMYDDLITRTYTIPLGGVPDWLIRWSRRDQAGSMTRAPALSLSYDLVDRRGRTRTLSARHTLAR